MMRQHRAKNMRQYLKIRGLFGTLVACGVLGGCTSLYLHDSSSQKSTDSAVTALGKLDTASVFSSETAYLNDLESREEAEVKAEYAAERDSELLLFLSGSGPGGSDGLTL